MSEAAAGAPADLMRFVLAGFTELVDQSSPAGSLQ